jgi:hypothetical protein
MHSLTTHFYGSLPSRHVSAAFELQVQSQFIYCYILHPNIYFPREHDVKNNVCNS